MDFLQIALILLITVLAVFLTITGFQVFLILKDLRKTLDKINGALFGDEKGLEKISATALRVKSIRKPVKVSMANPRRFFKKGF